MDTMTRLGIRKVNSLETLLRILVSMQQDRVSMVGLEDFFGRATTIGEVADLERWLKARDQIKAPNGLRKRRGPRKKKQAADTPTP